MACLWILTSYGPRRAWWTWGMGNSTPRTPSRNNQSFMMDGRCWSGRPTPAIPSRIHHQSPTGQDGTAGAGSRLQLHVTPQVGAGPGWRASRPSQALRVPGSTTHRRLSTPRRRRPTPRDKTAARVQSLRAASPDGTRIRSSLPCHAADTPLVRPWPPG